MIALISYSQNITNEPIHKKTNAVLIFSEEYSQQELFDKMVNVLIKEGYGIRALEKDDMYFISDDKHLIIRKDYVYLCYEITALKKYIKIQPLVSEEKISHLRNYFSETDSSKRVKLKYKEKNPNRNRHAKTYKEIYSFIDNLDVLVYIQFTKD